MIRANLLPRSRERLTLLGISVDVEHLRAGSIGLVLVSLTTFATYGVETVRLAHVSADASSAETRLAANAPRRDEAQRVAYDLARLEATARRAAALHGSGYEIANVIARLGNAIPQGASLDEMTNDNASLRLRGESATLDRIGETMTSLARTFPHLRSALGDVNDRSAGSGLALTFTADVGPADTPDRGARAPHRAPADPTP